MQTNTKQCNKIIKTKQKIIYIHIYTENNKKNIPNKQNINKSNKTDKRQQKTIKQNTTK